MDEDCGEKPKESGCKTLLVIGSVIVLGFLIIPALGFLLILFW